MKLPQCRFTILFLAFILVSTFIPLQAHGDTLPATLLAENHTQDETMAEPSPSTNDTDREDRRNQNDRDEDGTDDGRYDYRSDDGGGYYD